VRFTAEDAVREGVEAVVIEDACRAIAPDTAAAAKAGFATLGVAEIEAASLLG
jgi:nicotinamidase/pyrazinamidase